ncbi:hypothetical protein [Anaeromicropila herbilytica]|uniref:DUF2812 domain-containing protein n=1 Tax=Anaeromicropila herbilytica TaxID=2785025 RepID=A0A7R7EJN1_9FIRM|nr:hypothetical protein [Anaeromicropila herbilytica]BCN30012.1 hypothetical protein bsdtb5_13070 [Anaeromicropila herbilytica]
MKKYIINLFSAKSEVQLYDYLEANRKRGWCITSVNPFLLSFERNESYDLKVAVERSLKKDDRSQKFYEYGMAKGEYHEYLLKENGWKFIGEKSKMRVYVGNKETSLDYITPIEEYNKEVFRKYEKKQLFQNVGYLLFSLLLFTLMYHFDFFLFNFADYSSNEKLYIALLACFVILVIPIEFVKSQYINWKIDKIDYPYEKMPVLTYPLYLYTQVCIMLFLFTVVTQSWWSDKSPYIGVGMITLLITALIPDCVYIVSVVRNRYSKKKVEGITALLIILIFIVSIYFTYNIHENKQRITEHNRIITILNENRMNHNKQKIGMIEEMDEGSSLLTPVYKRFRMIYTENVVDVQYGEFQNKWIATKITHYLYRNSINWMASRNDELSKEWNVDDVYTSKNKKMYIIFRDKEVFCLKSDKIFHKFTLNGLENFINESRP